MTRSKTPTGPINICLHLCATAAQHIPVLWSATEDLLKRAIAQDSSAATDQGSTCDDLLKLLNRRYSEIQKIISPLKDATSHILDRSLIHPPGDIEVQPGLQVPSNFQADMAFGSQALMLRDLVRQACKQARWQDYAQRGIENTLRDVSRFHQLASFTILQKEVILQHKCKLEENNKDVVSGEDWHTWNRVVRDKLGIMSSADEMLKDLCTTLKSQTILSHTSTNKQTSMIAAVQAKRKLFSGEAKNKQSKKQKPQLNATQPAPQGAVPTAGNSRITPMATNTKNIHSPTNKATDDANRAPPNGEKTLAIDPAATTNPTTGTVAEVTPTASEGPPTCFKCQGCSKNTPYGPCSASVLVETQGSKLKGGGSKKAPKERKCKDVSKLPKGSYYFKCPAPGCEKVSLWSYQDEDKAQAEREGMLLMPPDAKGRRQIRNNVVQRHVKCLPKPGYTGMKEHLRKCPKWISFVGHPLEESGEDRKIDVRDIDVPPLYYDRRLVHKKTRLNELSKKEKKQRDNDRQRMDRHFSKHLIDTITSCWNPDVARFMDENFGIKKSDIPRAGFMYENENDPIFRSLDPEEERAWHNINQEVDEEEAGATQHNSII